MENPDTTKPTRSPPPPPPQQQPDPKKLRLWFCFCVCRLQTQQSGYFGFICTSTTTDNEQTAATTQKQRRKVAIFFAYCGVGYQGMQKNPSAKTIQGDLEEAIYLSGAVPEQDRLSVGNKEEEAANMDGLFHERTCRNKQLQLLQQIMLAIVKYCKRFPLAITVVGKSLFKESIEMWKEKVIEWSKGPILEEHTLLRDCLQPNLNVLCENASEDGAIIKECFIDLASLPEDGRIPAGLLIDMWAELHSLREDGSIVKLQQLNEHNLAKLLVTSKENEYADNCYSEQFVTQHDMLRELAVHQIRQDLVGESKRLNVDTCGDVLPQRLTQKKNKLKETRLLSISTDGVFGQCASTKS